ncbi:hypothetical protein J6W34_03455 [bacterium]|nr:hypothetical protein [bacterium]
MRKKFISSLLNAFNRFLKSSDNPYGKVATFEDMSEFKEYLYKYYDGDMLEEQFINLDLDKYFKKSGKVHKYLHLHSDIPSYSLQDDTKKAIIEMFSHNDWYRTFSNAVYESLSSDEITEVENYFKVDDISDINEIKLLDYLLKTHLTDMFDVKKIY